MEHRPDTIAHNFVFTMAGRCAICQRLEAEHLVLMDQPDPMTGCPADHKSISAALLIGERGLEWRRCPYCSVMVEGALRTGEVTGVPYGPGRGSLTERLRKRLQAWAGWVQFNGGDE
jgi:hypothetical protein